MSNSTRKVSRIVTAHRQTEGAGFVVRRPFPSAGFDLANPFLMLDEMGPVTYAPGKAVGAPDHPHRGFETVTYILDGETEHEDSAGHRGVIGAGDVQWMTAGRGVIHSEMPSQKIREEGGRMHGFQLWVNLPARDKMMPPRYQEIPRARIPEATSADGLASVRVVAGEALGAQAVIETRTPIAYHDWTLRPGANVETAIPASFAAYVYVFGGVVNVDGKPVADGQLAVLGEGDRVRFEVPSEAPQTARFLLLAGEPLNEPVAAYGPFVMNTREEIMQAIRDYQSGRMGEIVRTATP
ncbi:Putative chromosome condensation protein [Minicystis rosea]|nr:Putative chromosome condensation protein [Minicystis rosea]